MARYRADKNQPDIVDALRGLGASVEILSQVGKSCPDLLVGYHGINLLMEVKSGDKRLRPEQQLWADDWNG